MNLIEELRNGNEVVFKSIFDKYQSFLYNYVYARTKSEYLSEEVVQITFIKLWNGKKTIDTHIDIESVLFRIAKTTLIDELRKILIRQRKESEVRNSLIMKEKEESSNIAINCEDINKRLREIIEMLPPKRKKVFELSRFEGLSHKEISLRLDITPKSVENHINHALKIIRPYLLLFPLLILLISLN